MFLLESTRFDSRAEGHLRGSDDLSPAQSLDDLTARGLSLPFIKQRLFRYINISWLPL